MLERPRGGGRCHTPGHYGVEVVRFDIPVVLASGNVVTCTRRRQPKLQAAGLRAAEAKRCSTTSQVARRSETACRGWSH